MASPFTNFIAPSMLPNICDARFSSSRFSCASSSVYAPERTPASIDICLPGIASRVKRAPTSATRSEPFATTRNCTRVMTRKMTVPTTTSPCTTNSPKAFTISPASAFARMPRVVETLRPRRNSVVMRSSVGKLDTSRAFFANSATRRTISDAAMFTAISGSRSRPGTGMMSIPTIIVTITARTTSGRRPSSRSGRAASDWNMFIIVGPRALCSAMGVPRPKRGPGALRTSSLRRASRRVGHPADQAALPRWPRMETAFRSRARSLRARAFVTARARYCFARG
jgi:hypothetical protein